MTPARERLVVVLALLVVGGAVLLAATQTFTRVPVSGVREPVVVAGQTAAPALAPVGLALLALAGAITIAGRVARIVLGVLLVLLAAAVVALALPSLLDPLAGTAGSVRDAVGVTDVRPLEGRAEGTGWPLLAVVAGVLAAVLGAAVLVRSRRWTTGGRRFRAEPAAARRATDPVSEWDALTRGTDPTDDP